MAVCLIGTRWGLYLGEELRRFYKGPLFVCGRDHDRTKRVARKLRADHSFFDWRGAVRHPEVHALILALPARLHSAVGEEASIAGKHAFIEKPLATTVEGCNRLISAAEQARTLLMAGENVPFRSDIRHARRLLPEIGEPRLLLGHALHNVSSQHDLGLGILLDFSIHHIRAVRELFGEPDRVFASRAQSTVGVHETRDNVTLILSSATGWQAVLSLSWQGSAGRIPEFIATGSRGAMKIWPDGRFVDLYAGAPNRLGQLISRIRPYKLQRLLQSPELQRRRYTTSSSDRMGYGRELRTFMSSIETGVRDLTSARQARRDVEIAVAAERSLSSGRAVHCAVDDHDQACIDQAI